MNRADALRDLGDASAAIDARQERLGLPSLADADLTWIERTLEIHLRAQALLNAALQGHRPTDELLDGLGAHVLAVKRAVARAEDARIDTGQEDSR